MKSSLHRVKDAALTKAVLLWLRPRFRRYGEIRWVELDTVEHELSAELMLKGEPEPVTVSRARYRLETRNGRTWIVFHEIQISRAWAQAVLDDFFPELPLKVPDYIRPLLE